MVLGFKKQFPEKIISGEKIHSIRKGNRWKAGNKIHFATGVRTKNYQQFHFGKCFTVQDIAIYFPSGNVLIDGELFFDKETLAKNDGFESFDKMLDWFGKDGIEGQIIHWTDFKY
jgi:hypothetical protein